MKLNLIVALLSLIVAVSAIGFTPVGKSELETLNPNQVSLTAFANRPSTLKSFL